MGLTLGLILGTGAVALCGLTGGSLLGAAISVLINLDGI